MFVYDLVCWPPRPLPMFAALNVNDERGCRLAVAAFLASLVRRRAFESSAELEELVVRAPKNKKTLIKRGRRRIGMTKIDANMEPTH